MPTGCYYERTPGSRHKRRCEYDAASPSFIVAVLLVAAAVAAAVVLRKHAPPEPARLLPGADGFAYINLGWVRRANLAGDLPAVPHDPEYEQFIQATGFQFEPDLDEAALAIHYPAKSPDAKSDSAQPPTYSRQPVRSMASFVGDRRVVCPGAPGSRPFLVYSGS